MSDNFLIRDVFAPEVVKKVAQDIKKVYKPFDVQSFLNTILPGIEEHTYSERKHNITQALISYLPYDFQSAVEILMEVCPPPYSEGFEEGSMDRFYISTFTAYVGLKGLDDYDLSMKALYRFTRSFTSEWDIRPFLLKYPERTFKQLKLWVKDEDQHVRRLVSEGSRPNLPWGKKLKFVDENPEETTLPLLSLLQDDPSEYVRRSVANHINDLSKNNADLVVKHLRQWKKQNASPEKDQMINHALRTLIKEGHPGALALIGYDDDFDLEVEITKFTNEVPFTRKFEFEFSVKNKRKVSKKLLIDFIIGFQKKDGSIKDKVFKLKKTTIAGLDTVVLRKFHSFKPITTRVYHPGRHELKIQINGKIVSKTSFMLLKS